MDTADREALTTGLVKDRSKWLEGKDEIGRYYQAEEGTGKKWREQENISHENKESKTEV